jgi:hypothetical protein
MFDLAILCRIYSTSAAFSANPNLKPRSGYKISNRGSWLLSSTFLQDISSGLLSIQNPTFLSESWSIFH